MKSKFGSKALSLLLSLTMVLSMVPAMTLTAGAATLPSDANTPGGGYYPRKYWDTSVWGDTEPTVDDYKNRTLEDWKKLYSNITIVSSLSFNQLLSNGVYYLDHNVTVQRPSASTSYNGRSGLIISGDVTLILANNATLTVTGAPASGQNTGGGAGIELSSGNTLHIVGTGTVNAYGGSAASGSAGQGGQGYANYNNYGGAGGGAGIGTRGGAGGAGGRDSGRSNRPGRAGSPAANAGTLVVSGNVTVQAFCALSSVSGGGGGTGPAYSFTKVDRKKRTVIGGGGGGAGYPGSGIGAGGTGGGVKYDSSFSCGGGGGGTGYVNGYPGSGGGGGSTRKDDTEDGRCAGRAGNGTSGGAGGGGEIDGTAGGNGGSRGSSGGSGSYYHRFGISGGSGNNYIIWPKDECMFEVVPDTNTNYNSDNKAWMYNGSSLTPSIKVTHIPTGQTKTVGLYDGGYTYARDNTNIYGLNGYGQVEVTNSSNIRLVLSNARYTYSASQKLYFPIKEKVSFDNHADAEIQKLLSDAGMDPAEAVVSNGQSDKVLQVGVSDSTDAILAKANVPKLPGYTFLGWYNLPTYDGGNPVGSCIYDRNGELNLNSPYLKQSGDKYVWNGVDGSKAITTLYAMWKEADITLVLNARNGVGGGTYPNQKFGTYFPITAPTRTGYTFDGYYDEAGYADGKFTGVPVAKVGDHDEMVYLHSDGTTYGPSSDGSTNTGLKLVKATTLYAKWKPLEYTVRLWTQDKNGDNKFIGTLKDVESGSLLLPGNGADAGFNNNGKGVLELPDGAAALTLERNHYDFMGWNLYSDQDWAMFTANKESKFTPNSATVGSEGLDIYAAWKIKDNFDIQYNGNEGNTNGIKMGNVFKGEDYTIPATLPTRAGYSFTGWNTALNGSGETYQPGAKIPNVTKAMTLYAQWAENNSITYNANGGTFNTTLNTLKPAKGEQVTLTIPTTSDLYRTGYEFLGWSENKDAESATYTSANKTLTMGDSSVILYAVWKPVQVDIEYTAEDGQSGYFTWGDKPTTFACV